MNKFVGYNRLSPLIEDLKKSLPTIAVDLIKQNSDMSAPENQSFASNPDSPLNHSPLWHQFGIIEHSLMFLKHLDLTVLGYIEEWGLRSPIEANLAREIDGISKFELLSVVALLHDLGKFTARKINNEGKPHFSDHEIESGKIIRGKMIKDYLLSHGLTLDQIEYIARCSELHFELGKLRQAAKQTATGYSMSFLSTEEFNEAAQEIIDQNPNFALEIGILFIADSKSKSDVEALSKNDEEIQLEKPSLIKTIASRGLNENLIHQSLQMPVNISAAEAYLKQWARQNK